jgi:hypothetical protein
MLLAVGPLGFARKLGKRCALRAVGAPGFVWGVSAAQRLFVVRDRIELSVGPSAFQAQSSRRGLSLAVAR